MSTTEVVSYAMAIAGLALLVMSIAQLATARRLNAEAGNTQLLKLATPDLVQRGHKLAQAAPGTYFAAVAAAIGAGLATDARERAEISATMERAFVAASDALLARARTTFERGMVGVMLVGGASAIATAAPHFPMVLASAAAAAGLGGILLIVLRPALAHALAEAHEHVLPAFAAAIAAMPNRGGGERGERAAPRATTAAGPGLTFRIFRDDKLLREVTFTDNVIKIGTVPSAQLCLLDDPAVSRLHAIIDASPGDLSIIDLGTPNGTVVNGEKVGRSPLHDGDAITIGAYRLELSIGN